MRFKVLLYYYKIFIWKIMWNFTTIDIATAWRKFDLNGDETVTLDEFDQLLNQLNIKISPAKKQALKNDLDKYFKQF